MSESATVTLSSKGQLAIPRRIREAMGLAQGAQLTLVLRPDGSLEVSPVRSRASDLFGLLAKPGEPTLSLEDMEEAMRRAMEEEASR